VWPKWHNAAFQNEENVHRHRHAGVLTKEREGGRGDRREGRRERERERDRHRETVRYQMH
jgi:hypothetical protein